MKSNFGPSFSLHLVVGPPAAGKTTFARRLARERQAALVDIDTATEPIVQAALAAMGEDPNDRDSPRFKGWFRDPIYACLLDLAAANLPHIDVVLTGPFTKELANPHWLEQLPPKLGGNSSIIAYYVTCSPETLFARMKARGNPRDAAKLADWSAYLAYYGELKPPAFPHILVPTD